VNRQAEALVDAHELSKRYGHGSGMRAALDGLSLRVEAGEFVAVVGPSGCGKTTLLSLLGGLCRTFDGELELFGRDLRALSDAELAALRGRRIGFVFQAFHLLGHLSALDNVLAPALFSRERVDAQGRAQQQRRAEMLLEQVGLAGRGADMPAQLSGGERQRVAVARALLLEPDLLLCDEPTGNLDAETSAQIVETFRELHRTTDVTVIGVTHDRALTRAATRVVEMRAGKLVPRAQNEQARAPRSADAEVA